MSTFDFELFKNSVSQIMNKLADTLKIVSEDRFVKLAKNSLEDAAFRMTDNERWLNFILKWFLVFLSKGITPDHIVPALYILIGFCFLFFGEAFVQMAVSLGGFAVGFSMAFFVTALFSIEVKTLISDYR